MVQKIRLGARWRGLGVHPQHDPDRLPTDFNAFDKGADEFLARLEIHFVEAAANLTGEGIELTDQELDLLLDTGFFLDQPLFGFQVCKSLPQDLDPGFKFPLLNQPVGKAVDETRKGTLNSGLFALQGCQFLVALVFQATQAALVFRFQALRMSQQARDLGPNRFLHRLGRD